jgi:hypothetical protein
MIRNFKEKYNFSKIFFNYLVVARSSSSIFLLECFIYYIYINSLKLRMQERNFNKLSGSQLEI